MQISAIETFISGLADVQREEHFGYVFFFVGDDHRLPFVTLAQADNAYDSVSNLNREGVFRVNIGISKESYAAVIDSTLSEPIDYTVLNTFLPHPEYAKQHFVCILNPSGENAAMTQQLIREAHTLAQARAKKRLSPK